MIAYYTGTVFVKRPILSSGGYRLNTYRVVMSIRYTSAEMRAQILNQVRPLLYSHVLYVSILPDVPDDMPYRKPFNYSSKTNKP